MKDSALLTPELAKEAHDACASLFELLVNSSDRPEPRFVVLSLLDPRTGDKNDPLFEVIIGDPVKPEPAWKREYRRIARSKADLAHRFKMDTSVIAVTQVACLLKEDTFFEGGAHLHGLSAGASGINSYLDEAIARVYLSTLLGLLKRDLVKVRDSDVAFL
jgi:hypothetical protein